MRRVVTLTAPVVFFGLLVACGSRAKQAAPLPPKPAPVIAEPKKEVTKPTRKAEPPKPAPTIDHLAIHKDYDENPIAGEKKHLGKVVRETGVVSAFMPGKVAGQRVVVLLSTLPDIERLSKMNGGSQIATICSMPEEDVLLLKKEQTITVEGQFGEYDRAEAGSGIVSFYMVHCRVIREKN